jgi:hypothetical protein
MYILLLFSLSHYCTIKITTVSHLETNEIKGTMPAKLEKTFFIKAIGKLLLGKLGTLKQLPDFRPPDPFTG